MYDIILDNYWFIVVLGIISSLFIIIEIKKKRDIEYECSIGHHEHVILNSTWLIKPGDLEKYTGESPSAWNYRYAAYKLRKHKTVCKHCGTELAAAWMKIGEYNTISLYGRQLEEFETKRIIRWS